MTQDIHLFLVKIAIFPLIVLPFSLALLVFVHRPVERVPVLTKSNGEGWLWIMELAAQWGSFDSFFYIETQEWLLIWWTSLGFRLEPLKILVSNFSWFLSRIWFIGSDKRLPVYLSFIIFSRQKNNNLIPCWFSQVFLITCSSLE